MAEIITGGGVGEFRMAVAFHGGLLTRLLSHRKIARERGGGGGAAAAAAAAAMFHHSSSNQGPNKASPGRAPRLARPIAVVYGAVRLSTFLNVLHDVVSTTGLFY